MNTSRMDRILRRVLIIPVVAVFLGALAMYWQVHESNKAVAALEIAGQSLTQTMLLDELIVDQETGLRGYQMTGDPRFLEPYDKATAALPGAFDRRRELAINDERRAAVTRLEQTHDSWVDSFAVPLIATVQAGGTTADIDLNLQGKLQMDGIRAQIFELTRITDARRQKAVDTWQSQTRAVVIGMLVTALVVGLLIGLYMRRLLQHVSEAFRGSHERLRLKTEEIFASEQRLSTTLQSIAEGVITCDAEGQVLMMNKVAEDLTGWMNAGAHGRALETVLPLLDATTRLPIERRLLVVTAPGVAPKLTPTAMLLRDNGSAVYVESSSAPIRSSDGVTVGTVFIVRDITMMRRSQEALLANEKLAVTGRLAATIAHEIHNPLDSVSNLLYLMDGRCSETEHSQFLQLAAQEVARVTQISRSMLALHRESKSAVTVSIKEMLTSILLLMDGRFLEFGVTVEQTLPDGLVIEGFPAELRQVFTNLLTNAAEASERGDTIRVSARAEAVGGAGGGGVVIEIEDFGAGIAAELQQQLFTPFFTTKGEHGTGLGLWVSQGIVSKHGGRIELNSNVNPETHGTQIKVHLADYPTARSTEV